MTSPKDEAVTEALFATRNALVLVGKNSPVKTTALALADKALAGFPPFEAALAEVEKMKADAIAGGYWNDTAMRDAAPVADEGQVERVARAIHEGLGGDGWAYSNYGENEWIDCRKALDEAARNAIAALSAGGGVVESRS